MIIMNKEQKPLLVRRNGKGDRLAIRIRKDLDTEESSKILTQLDKIDCVGDAIEYISDVEQQTSEIIYIELRIPFHKMLSVPKKFWHNCIGYDSVILMGWFSLP